MTQHYCNWQNKYQRSNNLIKPCWTILINCPNRWLCFLQTLLPPQKMPSQRCWIWPGSMMQPHGAVLGEDPLSACHAHHQEPSMPKLFPALDGVATSQGSISTWGNPLEKTSNTFWLCFQNIGGLSQMAEGESEIKLQLILQFITNYQVDAFAFTEHNPCWDLLPPDKWLLGLTQGWWENSHWSIFHNGLDKNWGVYQPGGASMVVVNSFLIMHYGLGQTCWV